MRKFNHIAELIKRKRLSHPQGLSQSDLSHMLGYKNGQFISNVERALCNIPFKMINRVCKILVISPEEIKIAMLKDHEETLEAYLLLSDENVVVNSKSSKKVEEALENPSTAFNNAFGVNSQEQRTQHTALTSDFLR